jgi:tetratricopeptide (TPR) repeat protein
LSRLFAIALALAAASAQSSDLDEARAAQARGAELHQQGDLQGALSEFDRAVRLAPSSDLAWYNRGLVHRDLDDCRSAVADFSRALELQAEFFNALYQRGNCRQALALYADAVDDYSRAVAFPGRVHARFLAHLGRADALRRLGRLDEAYADYTRVAELRSDTRALRSRAWVQYYRGRWREAQADAARYLRDSDAKEDDAPYAVILGVLALRRAGDAQGAARFLRDWQPRLAVKEWPAPVLAYLADGDEKRLLGSAKDPGQRTEARAYLGANLLARGERSHALNVLKKVLHEDQPGYLEYDLAYYELERLGAATRTDRRALKR